MNLMAHAALWGMIPVTLALFAWMPARRAVLFAAFGGWLFLPQKFGYAVPGLPDYNKAAAIGASILLATIIFHPDRLMKFRPTWWDAPLLVWCLVPMVSAFTNNIGGSPANSLHGGVSMMLSAVRTYGLPYLIGRLYFRNFADLRALAIAFFVAGLVYVPFCLIEIRFTPQFHRWIYGAHAHEFNQTMRFGGYRPTVFMQHGLMVGMLLTVSVLCGMWLYASKSLLRFRGQSVKWLTVGLGVVALLSKSTGALALLMLGVGLFVAIKWMRWRWCLVAVVLVVPSYIFARGAGLWDGQSVVNVAALALGEDRAGSLGGRMHNESLFTKHARKRPFFGWSGWDRFKVYDPKLRREATADGLWLIALGQHGLVGLISMMLLFLLPVLIMLGRYPPNLWLTPVFGPAAVLSIVVLLFMLDCLLNAMIAPPYILAIGALMSVLPKGRLARASSPRRQGASRPNPTQTSTRTMTRIHA